MNTALAIQQSAFVVSVNYSQSLRQMIDAGGYEEVSKDINSRNFYLESTGYRETELTLVQFKTPKTPLEVLTLMKEKGCRPATIEELLSLGKTQPDLQRSIPIVGLGSSRTFRGKRWFPCLGGNQAKRSLALVVMYRSWSIYYRFAFVKE